MGLDPGLRTGVKVVVVDATGKLLEHTAIYPHVPQEPMGCFARDTHDAGPEAQGGTNQHRQWHSLARTDKLAKELIAKNPELHMTSVVVSEAGASVYSASAAAAKEFPDLDVTLRGAHVHRPPLAGSLAETGKDRPKAIGVGQYQHDVSQLRLARKLEAVVEDCVNACRG